MEHEERVTSLELFFDLVFVFAITQVTALLSDDPTLGGIGRGMLVLGALWWAWAAYAWLTNTVNPEEGLVRLAVFAATGAMVVVALAVPEAFDDHGVLFGAAQRLAESSGAAQAVLARDLYSYLHLPLVAGIVLFAMAMKKTLADVDATLDAAPAAALCGGLALYFLTYTALRFRVHAGLARGRTAAAIALLLLYPVAREVSALGALAAATGILFALIAYEAIHYREARARLRGAGAPA